MTPTTTGESSASTERPAAPESASADAGTRSGTAEAAASVESAVRDALPDAVPDALGQPIAKAAAALTVVKPRLRGWIHAVTTPLAVAACIVLVCLAPGAARSWACAAYLACTLLLFGNSGVYHISNGRFPRRVSTVLQRFDHANIYLLIAGTYTPLAVSLLSTSMCALVLGIVWGGAAAGIVLTLVWPQAPRWLTTLLYILLGWVALWFLPTFWRTGGPAIVWLLAAGGVVYTIGGVIYARRRPDPFPRWFGFHEIFHVCTVVAWVCHCVACYIAVLG